MFYFTLKCISTEQLKLQREIDSEAVSFRSSIGSFCVAYIARPSKAIKVSSRFIEVFQTPLSGLFPFTPLAYIVRGQNFHFPSSFPNFFLNVHQSSLCNFCDFMSSWDSALILRFPFSQST